MRIENFEIGSTDRVFVIAEIGMNHNGSMENALKLVDQACEAGADCVKFQMRNLNELYTEKALEITSGDLNTQYTINLLKKFELSFEQYKEISNYCRSKNVIFMCTPWDKSSADKLELLNTPAYKIASADLTNIELLGYVAAKKKPFIISTGMSSEDEIDRSVEFLKNIKADFAILHCNSTYPAPFKDINLRYIEKLSKYGVPVGYSGHERGIAVTLAAVAMGAKIVERHFTLDRNMEGPDHSASLQYADFKKLIEGIREIETALGTGKARQISQGEFINRENLGKSLYAKADIKSGTVFTRDMFVVKSPGKGISPQYLDKISGLKAKRNIAKDDCLYLSDIKNSEEIKRVFQFNRPWGIPVRYHDIVSFMPHIKPDFVEFHFSYKDLEENISVLVKDKYACGLIVHAPELFKNDHVLDLCSPDDTYRQASIDNMKKVIEITKKLKAFFPSASRPQIIIHCGGFTKDHPMEKSDRPAYYQRLLTSLNILAADLEIELLPENMAPFPWLFGGQRHQNIFVDHEEIFEFCKNSGFRICQDISHSYLTCTRFGVNHLEYTKKLAPVTAHYHISDAAGVDGEGLQIGEGEVDFTGICKIINSFSPSSASFIPEVWQGHKNDGEGFWISLKKLMGFLNA